MQAFNLTDHHKSRERVRDLGEVFTPEHYVEEMLDVLGKDDAAIWADLATSFFEPSCGPGNFVVGIFRRRLNAIFAKTSAAEKQFGLQYSIANALNSLWAVDIDAENVRICKDRVLSEIQRFVVTHSESKDFCEFVFENRIFIAHVLCALNWQIIVNEVTSALATRDNAERVASLTKTAAQWLGTHGHHPIDMNNTWVTYFNSCKESGAIPILFQNAERHIEKMLAGRASNSIPLTPHSLIFGPKADKRLSPTRIAG